MTLDLRDLYQEVIIDHSKRPRNFHDLPTANHHADGYNRLCGDKLTLYLQVKDGIIQDASFVGSGCAISTASASLMTDHLKGKTVSQAHEIFTNFHELLTAKTAPTGLDKILGKLTVLTGVREYPSRIKCATLAWHTLEAALNNEQQPVSTEDSNT